MYVRAGSSTDEVVDILGNKKSPCGGHAWIRLDWAENVRKRDARGAGKLHVFGAMAAGRVMVVRMARLVEIVEKCGAKPVLIREEREETAGLCIMCCSHARRGMTLGVPVVLTSSQRVSQRSVSCVFCGIGTR